MTQTPQPAAIPTRVAARAQKGQLVAYIAAVVIVIVFTAIAFTLHGKTDSGKSFFRPEDQVAMILLGLLCGVGVLWLTRPRIVATPELIRVRNLLGWIEVPWELVESVRFDRGSPWAVLDLFDDSVVSIMAVQAADKEYAVTAVRSLRAMLGDSREPAAAAASTPA